MKDQLREMVLEQLTTAILEKGSTYPFDNKIRTIEIPSNSPAVLLSTVDQEHKAGEHLIIIGESPFLINLMEGFNLSISENFISGFFNGSLHAERAMEEHKRKHNTLITDNQEYHITKKVAEDIFFCDDGSVAIKGNATGINCKSSICRRKSDDSCFGAILDKNIYSLDKYKGKLNSLLPSSSLRERVVGVNDILATHSSTSIPDPSAIHVFCDGKYIISQLENTALSESNSYTEFIFHTLFLSPGCEGDYKLTPIIRTLSSAPDVTDNFICDIEAAYLNNETFSNEKWLNILSRFLIDTK